MVFGRLARGRRWRSGRRSRNRRGTLGCGSEAGPRQRQPSEQADGRDEPGERQGRMRGATSGHRKCNSGRVNLPLRWISGMNKDLAWKRKRRPAEEPDSSDPVSPSGLRREQALISSPRPGLGQFGAVQCGLAPLRSGVYRHDARRAPIVARAHQFDASVANVSRQVGAIRDPQLIEIRSVTRRVQFMSARLHGAH